MIKSEPSDCPRAEQNNCTANAAMHADTEDTRHSGHKLPKNSTFQNAQISIFGNFKA